MSGRDAATADERHSHQLAIAALLPPETEVDELFPADMLHRCSVPAGIR